MVQRSIGNERKLNLVRPNAEEETEIAAQLAEDPDTYEWTEEDWANAQTTRELFPKACEWAVRQKEARKDGLLRRVTVTLDRETIAWVKAQTGENGENGRARWLELAAQTLRNHAQAHGGRKPGKQPPAGAVRRGGLRMPGLRDCHFFSQTGPNFSKSDNPVIRGLIFREFSKKSLYTHAGKINIENEKLIFPVVKPSNNPCRAVFQSI